MDDWRRRVLLEEIIYKMFRRVKLGKEERKMVDDIVNIREYEREFG